MKIGVVPTLAGDHGGVYQYSLLILEALEAWRKSGSPHTLFLYTHEPGSAATRRLKRSGWTIRQVGSRPTLSYISRVIPPGVRARFKRLVSADPASSDPSHGKTSLESSIQLDEIDVLILPVPGRMEVPPDTKTVMAIHDLQHRLQPHFPEVSEGGERERREQLFSFVTRGADAILADSETGRQHILRFYPDTDPERVHVLPYIAPSYLSNSRSSVKRYVRARYRLTSAYFFYPANFWPHKNHVAVIEAFSKVVHRTGSNIRLVLTGHAGGALQSATLQRVVSLAEKLGVEKQVRYLAYVPNRYMAALYECAIALVMPTYFGPTNIPVIEAWSAGCPVITSDIDGIRQQVGEAALLADPDNPSSIAEEMEALLKDESARRSLIEKGYGQLRRLDRDEFHRSLADVVKSLE